MIRAKHIQGALALALSLDDDGNIVGGKAVRSMPQLANLAPDVVVWSRPPSKDEEAFAESRLKATQGVQFVADPRPISLGVRIIHEERETHVAKGYTASHDDTHSKAELANAARCYLWHAVTSIVVGRECKTSPPSWPWNRSEFKSGPALRMLAKAGALIAAEIERLLRRNPELR